MIRNEVNALKWILAANLFVTTLVLYRIWFASGL